jgi:signal transduction histidine kinase
MSITRKIVEEHGGQIRLDSQVGRGTTFTVSLPVDIAAPAEPSSGAASPAARPAS